MTEESLDDLSEIVGPELANLVNCGGGGGAGGIAAAAAAGNSLTTLQPVKAAAAAGPSAQQQDGDLSDLKSSDLIQTLSAVIDIDKMFADFQTDHRDQQASMITFET